MLLKWVVWLMVWTVVGGFVDRYTGASKFTGFRRFIFDVPAFIAGATYAAYLWHP